MSIESVPKKIKSLEGISETLEELAGLEGQVMTMGANDVERNQFMQIRIGVTTGKLGRVEALTAAQKILAGKSSNYH